MQKTAFNLFSTSLINKIRNHKLQVSIVGVFILLFLLFIIFNPEVFLGYRIYYSFMSTIPLFGIMALAMTFVIILGEIDLSFPSVLAVSALIFGSVLDSTGYIWLAAFLVSMNREHAQHYNYHSRQAPSQIELRRVIQDASPPVGSHENEFVDCGSEASARGTTFIISQC